MEGTHSHLVQLLLVAGNLPSPRKSPEVPEPPEAPEHLQNLLKDI